VENKPGASGILAAETVVRAPADGYTLLWTYNAVISINPVVFAKLPYDPLNDFVAVAMVNRGSYVLVADPKLAAQSVSELVAMAKAKPGQLSYASYGSGGGSHLAAELLKSMAGIDLLHVPFKSGAMNEVMAGRVTVLFEPAAGAVPHVKAGKVKALAVAGNARYSALPDVPTVAETISGFEVDSWQGIFAPARTPREVVARINQDIAKVQAAPDIQKRLTELGFSSAVSTPEVFEAMVRSEMVKWRKLAADIKLKAE
jgi:tripartite-type tricarboxylate transporter receptor subunit TctC